MGYWNTTPEGHSFSEDCDLTWGDAPADVMGEAIEKIVKIFEKDQGRKPCLEEFVAGALFSGRNALSTRAKEKVGTSTGKGTKP